LIALHHIDIPWRPSDMEQREGRILRFGNQNKKIKIYRYITKKSFDAYSWQLLEIKEKVIRDVLSGMISERNQIDVGEQVLSYAEVKSLALGQVLMKKKCELENQLSKLLILRKKRSEELLAMREKIEAYPIELANLQKNFNNCLEDYKFVYANKMEYTKEERKLMGKNLAKQIALIEFEEVEILEYKGFKVFKIANMNLEKPQIKLERFGTYFLDIEINEVGILKRIDNFLKNLPNKIMECQNAIKQLKNERNSMEEEISKPDVLQEKIDILKVELEKIYQKMGLKK
jgi:hypothetical protein